MMYITASTAHTDFLTIWPLKTQYMYHFHTEYLWKTLQKTLLCSCINSCILLCFCSCVLLTPALILGWETKFFLEETLPAVFVAYEAIDWPGKPQVYFCTCNCWQPKPTCRYVVNRMFYGNVDDHILVGFYSVLVLPHLEYATPIWDPHLIKDTNKLESAQKFAIKMCLKQWDL